MSSLESMLVIAFNKMVYLKQQLFDKLIFNFFIFFKCTYFLGPYYDTFLAYLVHFSSLLSLLVTVVLINVILIIYSYFYINF